MDNETRFTSLVKEEKHMDELCSLLEDRWMVLAAELKITEDEISNIEKNVLESSTLSPSKQVLNIWKDKDDATVPQFIEVLGKMQLQNDDALILIYSWIKNQLPTSHPLYKQYSQKDSNAGQADLSVNNVNHEPHVPVEKYKTETPKVQKNTGKLPGEDEYREALQLAWKMWFKPAFALFKKSAELGYPPAFVRIQWINKEAIVCSNAQQKKQREQAKKFIDQASSHQDWFLEKAKTGNAEDQYNLAFFYHTRKDFKESIQWNLKSAEQDYSPAQSHLGNEYLIGRGVDQDITQALYWIQKAADQGFALAQRDLGALYEKGEGVPQDYALAVQWYKKAADQGLTNAQYRLGLCYHDGKGVPQDCTLAAYWWRQAAERGSDTAQFMLGALYKNGTGVQKDASQAVRWFLKAAKRGHKAAQYNLGICYEEGHGVEKDTVQAFEYYQMAADQGHKNALHKVGMCYHNGIGVNQDYFEAVQWLRKAADRGHRGATFNMGACYSNGQGVAKDYSEAISWYQKAAEMEHPTAQYQLGVIYYQGKGIAKDFSTAARWFTKAAENEFSRADFQLGRMHEKGQGFRSSYVTAAQWYSRVLEKGPTHPDYPKALKGHKRVTTFKNKASHSLRKKLLGNI